LLYLTSARSENFQAWLAGLGRVGLPKLLLGWGMFHFLIDPRHVAIFTTSLNEE